MLLSDVKEVVRLPAVVEAPYAVPRAVEAVVETPGIEAVRRATDVIVDTWVLTTLLSDVKEVVRLPAEVEAAEAVPRAVEAVVLTPGMLAVRSATDVMVET